MPITRVGRVMVPVVDQDAAIAFYTEKLGFTVAADDPFGDNDRWVEVAPPGGGTNLALETTNAAATHAQLAGAGVDVDAGLGPRPPHVIHARRRQPAARRRDPLVT